MAGDDSLPVLDIAGFREREAAGAGRLGVDDPFVGELRTAVRQRGFFYLRGHGVDGRLCDDVLGMARRFFALSLRQRMAIANVNSPQFRGYTPVGHEHTRNRPDGRDQLDIGPERPARARPGDAVYWRLEGPNQWPDALPTLRPTVLRFIDAMEQLALSVIRAIALSLGQPADRFDSTFAVDGCPHLKLIRYPAPSGSLAGSDQGVGPHKDYGFLALLLQDDHSGLQVSDGAGSWIEAPPRPGTFVCNIGEMFELVSRGFYRATVHRVVSPPPGTERISVPYFYAPRLDARLDPVELPAAMAEPDLGIEDDPANPLHAEFGVNALKGWLRSHPEVARRHWSDVHPDTLERVGP